MSKVLPINIYHAFDLVISMCMGASYIDILRIHAHIYIYIDTWR